MFILTFDDVGAERTGSSSSSRMTTSIHTSKDQKEIQDEDDEAE